MGKKSGKQKKRVLRFLSFWSRVCPVFCLFSDVLDFLTNATPSSAITLTVIVSWEREKGGSETLRNILFRVCNGRLSRDGRHTRFWDRV